jgi:hypothetical protein
VPGLKSLFAWRGWTIGNSILAAVAAIATIYAAYAAYITLQTSPPTAPALPVIVNPQPDSTGLTIVEADLETEVVKVPFLIFYTLGTDNFYLVDILIKNSDGVARSDCYMSFEYSGPNGFK